MYTNIIMLIPRLFLKVSIANVIKKNEVTYRQSTDLRIQQYFSVGRSGSDDQISGRVSETADKVDAYKTEDVAVAHGAYSLGQGISILKKNEPSESPLAKASHLLTLHRTQN